MSALTVRDVLVGVDEEGRSDHAARAGAELAERFHARLELLHVVERAARIGRTLGSPSGVPGTVDPVPWRERVGKRVETAIARPVDELLRFAEGHAPLKLLERARELDAGLVAIGPHRRRNVLDFGSTARALLAYAPGGVWIQKNPWSVPRRVLVPIDLSPHSLRALDTGLAIARAFGASVEVIHVFSWRDAAEHVSLDGTTTAWTAVDDWRAAENDAFERAVGRVEWLGVPHTARFVDGVAVESILESERKHDLVVLGSHGRTGFARVLVGSTAYAVARRAEKPVLVVRHPEHVFAWKD